MKKHWMWWLIGGVLVLWYLNQNASVPAAAVATSTGMTSAGATASSQVAGIGGVA